MRIDWDVTSFKGTNAITEEGDDFIEPSNHKSHGLQNLENNLFFGDNYGGATHPSTYLCGPWDDADIGDY